MSFRRVVVCDSRFDNPSLRSRTGVTTALLRAGSQTPGNPDGLGLHRPFFIRLLGDIINRLAVNPNIPRRSHSHTRTGKPLKVNHSGPWFRSSWTMEMDTGSRSTNGA